MQTNKSKAVLAPTPLNMGYVLSSHTEEGVEEDGGDLPKEQGSPPLAEVGQARKRRTAAAPPSQALAQDNPTVANIIATRSRTSTPSSQRGRGTPMKTAAGPWRKFTVSKRGRVVVRGTCLA